MGKSSFTHCKQLASLIYLHWQSTHLIGSSLCALCISVAATVALQARVDFFIKERQYNGGVGVTSENPGRENFK